MMEFLVPKKTQTFADALQAIGLGDLLSDLTRSAVNIEDRGNDFCVSLPHQSADDWTPPTAGFPFIWDSNAGERPANCPNLFDYRAALEIRASYRAFEKARRAASHLADEALAHDIPTPAKPPPQLEIATTLASMRSGWAGDKKLFEWLTIDPARALAWARHRLVGAPAVADPPWSNTQFLNPITGKGIHSPKTKMRAPNAISAELSDPWEDWHKLRAAFAVMIARRDGDDFKFFVVEPTRVSLNGLVGIASELRECNLWGGIRLDIDSVLRCTEILICRSDLVDGTIPLRGHAPRAIIGGLRQAFFKGMGQGSALMNDALLPLPNWFAITTSPDADQMLAVLEEFIGPRSRPAGCLGSLDVNNSDDGAILQRFRDWLLDGTLAAFLEFHATFATHVMQRKSRGKWVRPFSTDNLTFLLEKGYHMEKIISNPGFLSVARAIRNKTIYSSGVGGPFPLGTSFGLAQKWKMKLRAGKQDFVEAVAEFIQDYNWEAKQAASRQNRGFHVVKTEDLDKLVRLLDVFNVQTVGMLLLAYGYAQAPKSANESEGETQ